MVAEEERICVPSLVPILFLVVFVQSFVFGVLLDLAQ